MAGERTRSEQRRDSKLFVDRQYYERGAAGGRIVAVSRRTQLLLAAGFAFSTILCIVLVGVGVLGYRLYLEQGARLAALEAPALEPGTAEARDPGAGPAAVVGGTLAEMLQAREARIATLEQELALARDDLAAAETAQAAVDERLTREQDALRLKLENADRMRLDAETELAASRARIDAMQAELGAGGTAETLVDATGQPLAGLESVTPDDLAQLGMELRLVERERDGAREQLDRALERLAALEASVGADPVATADAAGVAADATADRLAELELAQSALQSENAQLSARLERRIAEQSELRAAAEASRRQLVAQIAERGAAMEAATAAAEARDALGRERDQLVEAQAILTAERDTLATERDALAAERDDLRARLTAAETVTTDVAALRAELAAALEASRAAETELLDRAAERAALEAALAAEQDRVAGLMAELSARGESEAADENAAGDEVADGEAAAAAAAALAALEERNRALEAAVVAAEAEADRATALASEATLLAERSATVEPLIMAERDEALASAADAAAEVQRLRDDNATLTKASRDALEAQGAAHEAALGELRAELALLQGAVAARDSENAELVAANEQLAAAAGTGADGSTSAALRAANERIEALEEELAATARLAAELGSSPGTVPISTADIATVNGTASAAELELALQRIKDLDAELSVAESRVSELQSLLEAEWPGPPRAAPR